MNIRYGVVDRHQEPLTSGTTDDVEMIVTMIEALDLTGDGTISAELESGETMLISFDRGRFTLLVLLEDDAFFDYKKQGGGSLVPFMQGGQLVDLDSTYVTDLRTAQGAIRSFLRDPTFVRSRAEWELQR